MKPWRDAALTGLIALVAAVTPIALAQASEPGTDVSSDRNACENSIPMLVADGNSDSRTGPEDSGGIQERAVPPSSSRLMKPVSIDPATGTIVAQSLVTGKIVRLQVAPAAIARHRMMVGVPFDVGKMSPSANGNCKCGQYSDGSCYCVSDVPECCGPLHGCPMASCDKKQPIPGAGDKPVFQTP